MPPPRPVVRDDGYTATLRDFAAAGVDDDAIRAMQTRTAPLGFTPEDWESCIAELRAALTVSGLDDADARIRGSSTHFFSDNPEKRFPRSEASYLEDASAVGLSEDEARERWRQLGFALGGALPTRHFFDSRYQLGLDTLRSDYAIQLSSDILATRMERYQLQYPNQPVVSTHGGHYKHEYVAITFPILRRWAHKWSGVIGRDINIAAFSGAGPGGTSSFKEDDWIIDSLPNRRGSSYSRGMLTYDTLARKPGAFTAMTGRTVHEFEDLLADLCPREEAARQERSAATARRRALGGGAKPRYALRERLLMTLVWLRLYLTGAALGVLCAVDQSTVSRTTRPLRRLLRERGQETRGWPEEAQALLDTADGADAADAAASVDATEQRVERARPRDTDRRRTTRARRRRTTRARRRRTTRARRRRTRARRWSSSTHTAGCAPSAPRARGRSRT